MNKNSGSIILSLIIAAVLGLIIYTGVQTILNSKESQKVQEQAEQTLEKAEKTQEDANQIIDKSKEVIDLN